MTACVPNLEGYIHFKSTYVIGQRVGNRPIMMGLMTGETALVFSLGKPLGNLQKAKEFVQPKISWCFCTFVPPLDPLLVFSIVIKQEC